jgi:hypothetical protein
VNNPTLPSIEEDIRAYLQQDDSGCSLDPRRGSTPPAPGSNEWYLTELILSYGGRPLVSGPGGGPQPPGGARPGSRSSSRFDDGASFGAREK